jgi:hypothetical protein
MTPGQQRALPWTIKAAFFDDAKERTLRDVVLPMMSSVDRGTPDVRATIEEDMGSSGTSTVFRRVVETTEGLTSLEVSMTSHPDLVPFGHVETNEDPAMIDELIGAGRLLHDLLEKLADAPRIADFTQIDDERAALSVLRMTSHPSITEDGWEVSAGRMSVGTYGANPLAMGGIETHVTKRPRANGPFTIGHAVLCDASPDVCLPAPVHLGLQDRTTPAGTERFLLVRISAAVRDRSLLVPNPIERMRLESLHPPGTGGDAWMRLVPRNDL